MTQNNVIPFPAHRAGVSVLNDSLESRKPTNPVSTHLVSGQSQGQTFDIQNYSPKGKVITLIEASKGTHQIPHKIFEFMFKATSTKVELIIFGCLIRYTLGFHRFECEASHSFIAEWTGLAIPNVRRGLDALLSASLIRKLQVGSCTNSSTIYEVPVVKGYLESIRTIQSKENTLEKSGPKSGQFQPIPTVLTPGKIQPLGLNQSQYCDQINPNTGINLIPKKDSLNKEKNINTLLIPTIPELIKNYFKNLKPEQKKRKELKHFDSLKEDYSVKDISDALNSLVTKGIPGSGNPCHSPMAFLACSMEAVLKQANARREKILKKETQAQIQAEKHRQEDQREAEESLQMEEHGKRFDKTFPTAAEQEAYFAAFVARFPFFKSNSYALRMAAISEWASKNRNHTTT